MKSKSFVTFLGTVLALAAVLFAFAANAPDILAQRGPSSSPLAQPTVTKKLNADRVDNFHAAAAPQKNRLLALDANAKFPDAAIPESIQRRVSGTCAAGSSIRVINANGTVTCEADDSGGGAGWGLTGNAGTNPTNNYVGTSDNQPLVIRTNNGERVRVLANGNVGIGTNAPLTTLHLIGKTNSSTNNTAVIENTAIGPHASNIHYGTTGDWYIRSAASAGKVVIQDTGGNVGIGTAAPTHVLDVQTRQPNAFAVRKSSGAYMLAVSQLGVAVQPYQSPGTGHVCYQDGYLSTCSSAAEYVPTIDGGTGFPETADVVSMVPNLKSPYDDSHGPFVVKKSTARCDANLLGFIVKPELGADGVKKNDHYLPLAIYGYFPVNVTMENGFVKRGDPLTSSSKPGYAMKATGACKIIGYALEDASNEGQIQVFANTGESTAAEVASLRGKVDMLTQENFALNQELGIIRERLDALEDGAQVKQDVTVNNENAVAVRP